MRNLQVKTCCFCKQPGIVIRDCTDFFQFQQNLNYFNYLNFQKKKKKLNNGRRLTSNNQNYQATTKRSRDDKNVNSLPKAKRTTWKNFNNNNNIDNNDLYYENNSDNDNNSDNYHDNNVSFDVEKNTLNRRVLRLRIRSRSKSNFTPNGNNKNIIS